MYKTTKIFQSIFSLIIIILVFSTFALSQEKSKLPLLKENASLEEIQKWLTNGIRKFGKYSNSKSSENQYTNAHKNEHNSVTEIKFEGCKHSYMLTNKTNLESRYLHSPIDSVGSPPSAGTSRGNATNFENSTIISLNLAEMNSSNINYTDLTPDGMKTIIISSRTGEKNVVYKTFYKKLNEKTVFQNRAIFIIKENVAEQIKNGLAQAIKNCRTAKI